jgi:tripartite-type tricarboxylate transporter receptor subunit TctC
MIDFRKTTRGIALAALFLFADGFAGVGHAQSPVDFKGKTINLNIGFGPGGGYDTYGRVLAAHFGKHLPGNPTVVPRNMPGAGGLKLAIYLYSVAPKDGTQIGLFASSVAMEPSMGNDQAMFDANKFGWLGSIDQDVAFCGVWQGPGAPTSFKEILEKETTFGTSGPGATSSQHPMILKNILHAKVKPIAGYEGTRSVSLAMQRGEVAATCGLVTSAIKASWMDDVNTGRLKLVIQMGPKKSTEFGDVPSVYDFAKSDEDRAVMDVHFKQILLARPIVAPPELPANVLATMRSAFMATMADADFLADAKKINISIDPASGEEAQRIIADLTNSPPAIIAKARAAIGR